MREKKKHPNLAEYLKAFKENTPQRDPEMSAKGRAHFLAEAESLRKPHSQPWYAELRDTLASLQIRGNRRLATAFASILIALMVTFAAAGGTVYASQDSLPNQTLYAVKTFTEDLRLRWADDPQQRIDLLEEFAQRRTQEMDTLSEKGQRVPQQTLSRFEQHTETMLQLAADMEGEGMTQSLSRIKNALQVHQEVLQKLANKENGQAVQALQQVQQRLQEKIQLAEVGLANPSQFKGKMKEITSGKPGDTGQPDQPSETTVPEDKGKPDDVGTPENKGKPDQSGTPDEAGKPDQVGTPENKGKPDDVGPPETKGKPQDPGPPEDRGDRH